jgi:hypothetical protein
MTKPFDIPAINNRLEALANHLGINSEVESELSTIEQKHTTGPVHTYMHNNFMYFVAHSAYGLAADKLVEFNSNLWAVLAQKAGSPYERFYDAKVMAQLSSISPNGYKLIAINQKEHKILYRTQGGFLVAWSFGSHQPNDIETYYLRGSIADGLNDIAETFTKYYTVLGSDQMLCDQSFEIMAPN